MSDFDPKKALQRYKEAESRIKKRNLAQEEAQKHRFYRNN